MNKRIKAQVEMYEECYDFFGRNAEKIAGYTPLEEAVITLGVRLEVIRKTLTDREKNIKGFTVDKQNKRKVLAEQADVLRLKIQAVAFAKRDDISFVNANITYSDVYRASAVAAVGYAQIIYDLANAIAPADQALFNITPDDLEIFNASLQAFSKASVTRRSSLVSKQTSGDVLNDLIKSMSTFIYDNISRLMGNYKLSDNALYQEWLHAKTIIDPAQNHGQITGQVVDAETQQPLQMVRVRVTLGDRVFEDMTDSKGIYKVPVNPEIWSAEFILPTYEKVDKTNIIVDPGERQKLNVKLTKV